MEWRERPERPQQILPWLQFLLLAISPWLPLLQLSLPPSHHLALTRCSLGWSHPGFHFRDSAYLLPVTSL